MFTIASLDVSSGQQAVDHRTAPKYMYSPAAWHKLANTNYFA